MKPVVCKKCKGVGSVAVTEKKGNSVRCPKCDGTGWSNHKEVAAEAKKELELKKAAKKDAVLTKKDGE